MAGWFSGKSGALSAAGDSLAAPAVSKSGGTNGSMRFRGLTSFLVIASAVFFGFREMRRISAHLRESRAQTGEHESRSVKESEAVSSRSYGVETEYLSFFLSARETSHAFSNLVKSAEERVSGILPMQNRLVLSPKLSAAAHRGVAVKVFDSTARSRDAGSVTMSLDAPAHRGNGRFPAYIVVDGITSCLLLEPSGRSAVRVVSPRLAGRLELFASLAAHDSAHKSPGTAREELRLTGGFHLRRPVIEESDGVYATWGLYGFETDDDVWLDALACAERKIVVLGKHAYPRRLAEFLRLRGKAGVAISDYIDVQGNGGGEALPVTDYPPFVVIDDSTVLFRCTGGSKQSFSVSFAVAWPELAENLLEAAYPSSGSCR